MHSEKQKTFIQIQKQKYERIGQDMEYYKKQARKGKNSDAILSVRGSINPNNSKLLIDQSIDMDMNDSFIFKMSPGKNERDTSMRSRRSGRRSVAPQMVSQGCQADEFLS